MPRPGGSKTAATEESTQLWQQKILNDIRADLPSIILSCLQDFHSEKNHSNSTLEKTLSGLVSSVKDLKEEIQEIKKSQNFITQKFDEFDRQIKSNLVSIKANKLNLDKEHEEITRQNKLLQQLTTKFDEMDRLSRLDLLEFHGLPKTASENVENLVAKVISKMDIHINDPDILYAHRKYQPRAGDSKPPPIIAKFCSRKLRNKVYESRSKLRQSTNQSSPVNSKTFIVESLTEKNRDLFFKARELKKQTDFMYLWTKNGKILAKKNQETSHLLIQNEADLQKIK